MCASSSVASPYIFVGASINLHSSCSRSALLPSVWGQVIWVLLVSCLMGSVPAALNS